MATAKNKITKHIAQDISPKQDTKKTNISLTDISIDASSLDYRPYTHLPQKAIIPYGYYYDESRYPHLFVDEEARPYIEFIYDEFLRGSAQKDIFQLIARLDMPGQIVSCTPISEENSNEETDEGACPSKQISYRLERQPKSWTRSAVRNFLTQRLYIGEFTYYPRRKSKIKEEYWEMHPEERPEIIEYPAGTVIKNHHEAIISPEIFERTQMLLQGAATQTDQNKQKGKSGTNSSNPKDTARPNREKPLYTHRIFCGRCGESMIFHGWSAPNSPKKKQWICSSAYYQRTNACPKHGYLQKDITPQVTRALLQECDQAIRLYELCKDGILSEGYQKVFNTLSVQIQELLTQASLEESQTQLQEELADLISQRNNLITLFNSIERNINLWLNLYTTLPDSVEMTKELSLKYIAKIIVNPNGDITFIPKQEDHKAKLLPLLDELL